MPVKLSRIKRQKQTKKRAAKTKTEKRKMKLEASKIRKTNQKDRDRMTATKRQRLRQTTKTDTARLKQTDNQRQRQKDKDRYSRGNMEVEGNGPEDLAWLLLPTQPPSLFASDLRPLSSSLTPYLSAFLPPPCPREIFYFSFLLI